MKIGLFTDTFSPEINGVVSSVVMLREGLEARGHEVWVFAPGHPLSSGSEDHVIRIPSVPLVVLPERRVATPLDVGMLHRIRDLDLDIIHTQTEFGVGSFGFRAAARYHIPHVHTYHTVWEEYTHYVALRLVDAPTKAAVRKFTRSVCKRCDRVIAPTRKTAELLKGYRVTAPIDIAPTGVDLARFSPGERPFTGRLAALRTLARIDRFAHTILSVGRVAPEKSVVELMEMVIPYLNAHPDTCFLVVGDGPSRAELETMAAQRGVAEQVVFTGEVAWKDVPDFYRLADVLVGNSHTETQGLTFIEALASGVPLVVRYNSCFDGIIENGVSGDLFDEAAAFVPALERILGTATENRSFRAERIAAGLAAARAVSKERFAENVETVYLRARGEASA